MIPIFFAADIADYEQASIILNKLGNSVDIKLGLEFFIANGPDKCRTIRDVGSDQPRQLFLDLKLHDIPTTVGNAVRAALSIEPDYISIHACGGIAMMQAAKKAADEAVAMGLKRPKLLGVTTLTSANYDEIAILAYAKDALMAGLDGLVCPPDAIVSLQFCFQMLWPTMFLMVPGIRSNHNITHDHHRTGTARRAMFDGADALVIGREIRDSDDPLATVIAIRETLKDSK